MGITCFGNISLSISALNPSVMRGVDVGEDHRPRETLQSELSSSAFLQSTPNGSRTDEETVHVMLSCLAYVDFRKNDGGRFVRTTKICDAITYIMRSFGLPRTVVFEHSRSKVDDSGRASRCCNKFHYSSLASSFPMGTQPSQCAKGFRSDRALHPRPSLANARFLNQSSATRTKHESSPSKTAIERSFTLFTSKRKLRSRAGISRRIRWSI